MPSLNGAYGDKLLIRRCVDATLKIHVSGLDKASNEWSWRRLPLDSSESCFLFIDVAMRLRQDTQHQIATKRESARIALRHHFALNTYRDLAINLDLAHVKNRPTSQRARYSRCRLIRCRQTHRLAATRSQWMATPAFLQAATTTSDPHRVDSGRCLA